MSPVARKKLMEEISLGLNRLSHHPKGMANSMSANWAADPRNPSCKGERSMSSRMLGSSNPKLDRNI